MEEQFELPVDYKGEQLMLKASLLVTGYTHKFNVDVNGQILVFEPDEERNYRAVIPQDDINTSRKIDKNFLKAITTAIEEIIKQVLPNNYYLSSSTNYKSATS